MYCTWSFSAEPVPTTASLIWLGENSSTSRSRSAHATSAAPRACPVANALCTFTPNHTVSMPTHAGSNRAITAAICSCIFRRRWASGRSFAVDTQPYAVHARRGPRCSTMPQPVSRHPAQKMAPLLRAVSAFYNKSAYAFVTLLLA